MASCKSCHAQRVDKQATGASLGTCFTTPCLCKAGLSEPSRPAAEAFNSTMQALAMSELLALVLLAIAALGGATASSASLVVDGSMVGLTGQAPATHRWQRILQQAVPVGSCPSPNNTCPDPTHCCSSNNFCGTTAAYCGAGCLSGPCFGTSNNNSTVGACINNTCPDPSLCCSASGYCGATDAYCGAGCLGGPCFGSSSTAGGTKHPSAGVIAGIVTGVTLLVLILSVTVYWWRRKTRSKRVTAGATGASTGAPCIVVTPREPVKIAGLLQGELFVLATAQNYIWTDSATLPDGPTQPVEAGVNDTQLDMMLKTQQQNESAAVSQYCPAVQLSMEELRQQVHLLSDGLLGRGATALVFKCVWPSRFGPNALLAAKVLQNGFESDMSVLSSFSYEANLLATTQHPHVVKLYGYCLEPPTVCLILELLPCSLKDVLYKTPTDAASSKAASSQLITNSAAAVSMTQASSLTAVRATPTQQAQAGSSSGSQSSLLDATATAIRHPAHSSTPENPATPSDSMAHHMKPVTLHQIVRICTDVAAGLAYLHNQPAPDATTGGTTVLQSMPTTGGRIVHRDLKPANILLNTQGLAKISDFGLARQHDHTTFATMNLGAGTLPYMAPELLVSSKAGLSGAACTNRVDIYSLGIIMWELLMSQPPWKGMAPTAILAAVMNRCRLPLPGDVASADREHATMEVPLLHALPAHSHPDLPKMCQIMQACWHHRELRRPTAAALHGTLAALMQQLEKQEKEQQMTEHNSKVLDPR